MTTSARSALRGARSAIAAIKRALKGGTRNGARLRRNNYINVYNLNLYKITAR